MTGGDPATITVSKLTTIKELRAMVKTRFDVEPEYQNLFFQGKKMEDEFSLFDYSVKVNDMIQLMIRKPLGEINNLPTKKESKKEDVKEEAKKEEKVKVAEEAESKVYKVGDGLDVRDRETGAWFEARIVKIMRGDEVAGGDGLAYHIVYEGYPDFGPVKVKYEEMRPRAKVVIPFTDLDLGMDIMVNYNMEEPEERGWWYEAKVTGWKCTSSLKSLVVSVCAKDTVANCKIKFIDEVMKLEDPKPVVSEVVEVENDLPPLLSDEAPGEEEKCQFCGDNKNKPVNLKKKCKECGCRVCGGKEEPNSQIMCDECSGAFHVKCIGKSMAWLAGLGDDDEWFCPDCKNDDDIVGGSSKMAKKKLAAGTKESTRDWGKGFACTGRNKTCTKVDKNHFGPIPGIEVGMAWKFRMQISEEGLHRPPVAGIAGTDKLGCPSLILSGGYEDDEDHGDWFTYTGAGGRDLSGNKRTAEQSFDQKLDRSNAAIARNCKARFDNKNGGDAGDKWKEGKPIRVLRNYKAAKHSKYAPEEGNRYDGIYKCVRYWPQKGASGFIVWRYEIRRDDPTPAPWSKEGKKRMEELGYELIYPEGYLEAEAEKEKAKEKEAAGKSGKGKKRKAEEDSQDEEEEGSQEDENDNSNQQASKKQKTVVFQIPSEWAKLIDEDAKNVNTWAQVKEKSYKTRKELTDDVEEVFGCIVCMDIVYMPVTTPCSHNICLACLKRSFDAEAFTCPACREDLPKDLAKESNVNKEARAALNKIFPGYEVGR